MKPAHLTLISTRRLLHAKVRNIVHSHIKHWYLHIYIDAEGKDFTVNYDKLVIAVGSVPNTLGLKDVEKNTMFLRDLQGTCQVIIIEHNNLC